LVLFLSQELVLLLVPATLREVFSRFTEVLLISSLFLSSRVGLPVEARLDVSELLAALEVAALLAAHSLVVLLRVNMRSKVVVTRLVAAGVLILELVIIALARLGTRFASLGSRVSRLLGRATSLPPVHQSHSLHVFSIQQPFVISSDVSEGA